MQPKAENFGLTDKLVGWIIRREKISSPEAVMSLAERHHRAFSNKLGRFCKGPVIAEAWSLAVLEWAGKGISPYDTAEALMNDLGNANDAGAVIRHRARSKLAARAQTDTDGSKLAVTHQRIDSALASEAPSTPSGTAEIPTPQNQS